MTCLINSPLSSPPHHASFRGERAKSNGILPRWAETLSYNGMSGHLATISDQQENDFIAALVPGHTAYIGGYQPVGSSEPSGGWTWVTGESFSYYNWHSGEPNDDSGNRPENYLQIYGTDSMFYTTWNDITDYPDWYVVEYESGSTPKPCDSLSGSQDTNRNGYSDKEECELGYDWINRTDTDEDGLDDIWEAHGYYYNRIKNGPNDIPDVDLPKMGADASRKDLFVEVDWMSDSNHTYIKPNIYIIILEVPQCHS